MLNFDMFKETVVEAIKEYLPEEFSSAEVNVTEVLKNNGIKLTGITVRKEEASVSPTVYIKGYYDLYKENDGENFDDIMERIAHLISESSDVPEAFVDVKETPGDWEKSKDLIVPRIINTKANEELLKDRPHMDVEDLSVTYHIRIDRDASIAVTSYFLKLYEKSQEILHEFAMKNMRRDLPYRFNSMEDVIGEIMCGIEAPDAFETEEVAYMYCLSNIDKTFGAAYVLDTELMNKIEEKVGPFWVLPSSIHEVLIVPKSQVDANAEEMLNNMVQEVNSTEVPPEDILSDHIYEYTKEGGFKAVAKVDAETKTA